MTFVSFKVSRLRPVRDFQNYNYSVYTRDGVTCRHEVVIAPPNVYVTTWYMQMINKFLKAQC